jgi:hypothetical protein
VGYQDRFGARPFGQIGYSIRHAVATLYGSRRFVIECPAPSTTILLAMKTSIIFISALSLAAMMLASCNSVFAPDETPTTGATWRTNETPPERSADSGNSISAGAY